MSELEPPPWTMNGLQKLNICTAEHTKNVSKTTTTENYSRSGMESISSLLSSLNHRYFVFLSPQLNKIPTCIIQQTNKSIYLKPQLEKISPCTNEQSTYGPTITDIVVKHFVSNHNSNSVFITTNGYFEKNFHFLIIFGQGNL